MLRAAEAADERARAACEEAAAAVRVAESLAPGDGGPEQARELRAASLRAEHLLSVARGESELAARVLAIAQEFAAARGLTPRG